MRGAANRNIRWRRRERQTRGAKMKRFIVAVLLLTPLAFGAAGCKKAHEAGNDSMSAGGGKMEVSASAPGNGASPAARQ
jgi:hypothetical protein